jgi:hypothetical protein
MKHLKKFNESRYSSFVKMTSTDIPEKRNLEEKIEELYQRLEIDDIIGTWEVEKFDVLKDTDRKTPVTPLQFTFIFKSNITEVRPTAKPRYEWPRDKFGNTVSISTKWQRYRKDCFVYTKPFDEELEEMKKMLGHSSLNREGFMVSELDWQIHESGEYYDGGILHGTPKMRSRIVLKIIEPTWWKGKSVPYKEISDKEAGIT